ncbi:MAG: LysR family transcriptional regulator [Kangiellaceae bacterium]|nr:LysR family transcriptional regulator [Kangiellaceae bacterium]
MLNSDPTVNTELMPPKNASTRIPSRKSIPPFESLRAFDAVARLGGIRKAAQALLRDHAVVSRHLKAVEDWTGCILLERTPSGAILTEEGKTYHRQITQAIDLISEATIDLMKRGKDNSLQVWCMPGFALHWMISHLEEFEAANPNIDFELRSTSEDPDFSRHEADVDIRIFREHEREAILPPNVKSEEIARPAIIPVASAEYLSNSTPITKPEDLLSHQLLHEEDFDNWRVWFDKNGLSTIDELSGPRLWDGHMTLAAAKRGRGIALSNLLVVSDDLASGKLVQIGSECKDFNPVTLGAYYFIARADRWQVKPVARFREWLIKSVAKKLNAE